MLMWAGRWRGKKKYMTRSMPLKQFKPDFLTFTKPFYQDLLVTCCEPANVQVMGFAVIIQEFFQDLVLGQRRKCIVNVRIK